MKRLLCVLVLCGCSRKPALDDRTVVPAPEAGVPKKLEVEIAVPKVLPPHEEERGPMPRVVQTDAGMALIEAWLAKPIRPTEVALPALPAPNLPLPVVALPTAILTLPPKPALPVSKLPAIQALPEGVSPLAPALPLPMAPLP